MRSLSAGGCDFERNLDRVPSDAAPWMPQVLPSVVTLAKIPADLTDPKLHLDARNLQTILTAAEDERIIAMRGARMRVHKTSDIAEPVAVLVPLDRLFDIRVAFALRLWRGLVGRKPGPNPAALTPDRRRRLILALRALDGRLARATYPEIAAALLDTAPISKRDWISHELRDQTGRLVRLGFKMMKGGYKQLLLYPYRRRI